MKKIKPILLILFCGVWIMEAADLSLDFKGNGEINVVSVAAGKLPGGFTVKERIYKKTQAEVILQEDFQKE